MKLIILITLFVISSCGANNKSVKAKIPDNNDWKSREPIACPDAQERASKAYLTSKHPWNDTLVYEKTIPANENDIILVIINAEYSNGLRYTIMMGHYLEATTNDNSQYLLGQKAAANITQDMHHYIDSYSVSDIAKQTGHTTYRHYVYFASPLARPNDFAIIEQCYGQMQVINITQGILY